MVINGISHNVYYFSSDFPAIEVTEIKSFMSLCIKVDSLIVYNENFSSADAYFGDLGSLLTSYVRMPFLAVSDVLSRASDVRLEFTDELGMVSFDVKVFYSRMKIGVLPETLNFFVSRYKEKESTILEKEFFSFVKRTETHLKIGVAAIVDKKAKYIQKDIVLTTESNVMLSKMIGIADAANVAGVSAESVIYYDVILVESSAVTDKIRIVADKKHHRGFLKMLYHNAVGMPESFSFTGYIKNHPDLESEHLRMIQASKRINAKIIDNCSANTGFLSTSKLEALKDLLTSDEVCSYKGNQLDNIIIKESELSYTAHSSQATSATVSFIPADYRQLFNRQIEFRERIFDKTFDYTFD